MPLKCHSQLITKEDYASDEVAFLFDLPGVEDSDFFDAKQARILLFAAYQQEKHLGEIRFPQTLEKNLKELAMLVGLNQVECQLLGFVVLLENSDLLERSCQWLGSHLTSSKMFNVLSILLNIPQEPIRKALAGNSALVKTGLLSIEHDYRNNELSDKISVLSRSFSRRLFDEESGSPIDWLQDVIFQSPPPHLTLDNYPHVKNLDLLLPYLQQAVQNKTKGVNIFIYGTPGTGTGTGKSQLARLRKTAGLPVV